MRLSRRTFTREMKLAAIQRLETGSSIAEVARAFEVNPNVLHRWRREFRQGPGNAFPGGGKRRWDEHRYSRFIGDVALHITASAQGARQAAARWQPVSRTRPGTSVLTAFSGLIHK